MAYEFNNDDHFDMKSQMMVGKIGENRGKSIFENLWKFPAVRN